MFETSFSEIQSPYSLNYCQCMFRNKIDLNFNYALHERVFETEKLSLLSYYSNEINKI
jgi:hypothetical protein